VSSSVLSVEEAIERTVIEIAQRPNLRIVAVSGPGEPLANMETFELMGRIHEISPDMEFCLSTNGVLLNESIDVLVDLGVKALSVTLNTLDPLVASLVYEWAILDGEVLSGIVMGRKITTRQAQGISMAVEAGILVKANTILIPGINDHEIAEMAESISDIGVSLHNIVPLVPCSALISWQPPSPQQICVARKLASNHIRQFRHCRQCRSDVVGVPEMDEIL
jgi:nitrogen fixation protein NifB